jgi:hypothetical protein
MFTLFVLDLLLGLSASWLLKKMVNKSKNNSYIINCYDSLEGIQVRLGVPEVLLTAFFSSLFFFFWL